MSIGGESIPTQAEVSHMTIDEAIASGLFDMPDEPGMVRIPISINMMIPNHLLWPPEPEPAAGHDPVYSPHGVPPPHSGPSRPRQRFGNYPKAIAAQRIAATFKDTLRPPPDRQAAIADEPDPYLDHFLSLSNDTGRAIGAGKRPAILDLVYSGGPVAGNKLGGTALQRAVAGPSPAARQASSHAARHSAAVPSITTVPADQNSLDLAAIMQTEAGGPPGKAALIAVGLTVRNRMQRNNTKRVRDVWSGYKHHVPGYPGTIILAQQILSGAIKDTTDGATHFYTPKDMAKEGKRRHGDTGGGLESVPGVLADNKPIRNYRPSWTKEFILKTVKGVKESDFEFYQQRFDGRHVR